MHCVLVYLMSPHPSEKYQPGPLQMRTAREDWLWDMPGLFKLENPCLHCEPMLVTLCYLQARGAWGAWKLREQAV